MPRAAVNEAEEDDHVTDDDADQAGDAEECHEPEWGAGKRERDQRANNGLTARLPRIARSLGELLPALRPTTDDRFPAVR